MGTLVLSLRFCCNNNRVAIAEILVAVSFPEFDAKAGPFQHFPDVLPSETPLDVYFDGSSVMPPKLAEGDNSSGDEGASFVSLHCDIPVRSFGESVLLNGVLRLSFAEDVKRKETSRRERGMDTTEQLP